MDTTDLQGGFRLGDWLVEPRESRITGPVGTRMLSRDQLRLLLTLAENHGAAVSRSTLCERVWPEQAGGEQLLRTGIRQLRGILGGSPQDQGYIVGVARDGFALIGHLERLPSRPAPPEHACPHPASASRRTFIGRLQSLVIELRRRSVFKVAGAYLVGMWVVLQVAETTFEPLRFPEWWMTALTILAVLGLPIVAILAWSYEITPGGIVLDDMRPDGVTMPRARRAIAPVAVAGVALMAGVTGVAWWRSIGTAVTEPSSAADPAHPSVAVLPLVDMSPAGGNAYLGDGLSEELSMRLAQIPGLRVAARTSAFEFKDRNLDVRRIGEALGVRHVLEGSVRREGDKLRVTVQLIDARTGYHVWSGSYDRGWRDVIAIQDDIARSVTDTLRVVLASRPAPGDVDAAKPDLRAFDPYLEGLAMLRQSGDMSRLNEAAQRFEAAIAIDPSFARAHAGLCQVRVRQYDRTRDPAELDRAEQSCRRALELEPALIETEKALAALLLTSGRHPAAEAIYRSLVARYPRDADGHIGLGRALDAGGRVVEAEASLRAAVQVEPAYWGSFNELGGFLFEHGHIDGAIDAFREVTELAPSSASAYNNLGAALQMKGNLAGAAEAFRGSLAIEPSRSAYSNLGTVHYFRGEFGEAAANYQKALTLAEQDHTVWGNFADAVWQIPERRAEAARHYRRAIGLAERDLDTSSGGPALLLAQLAYYWQRVGAPDRADRYLARALELEQDSPFVAYYAAVTMSLRGQAADAQRFEALALDNGYPRFLIDADPVLRAGRGT